MRTHLIVTMLLVGLPVAAAPAGSGIDASLRRSVDQAMADLPMDGDAARVHLLEHTDPLCAGFALRQARTAVHAAGIRAGAWRSFRMTVDVATDVLSVVGLDKAADLMELIMHAVDAASPEDFVKGLGSTAVRKLTALGAERLGLGGGGQATMEAQLATLTDAMAAKALENGAGAIYGWALARPEEALLEQVHPHPACGDIHIAFHVARASRGGLEFRMHVSGNCGCAVPEGSPVRLGRFSVYGVLPLRGEIVGSGRQASIRFDVAGPGAWWVIASSDCTAPPEVAGDPVTAPVPFLPSDAFTTADLRCTDMCWQVLARREDHRALALDRERRAAAIQGTLAALAASAADATDRVMALEDRLAAAEAALRTPVTGSPSEQDRRRLVEATAVVERVRRGELDALRRSADPIVRRHRSAAREFESLRRAADLHHDLARRATIEYEGCVRACVREACAKGEPIGTGGGTMTVPAFGDQVQRDARRILAQMEAEGFECLPGRRGPLPDTPRTHAAPDADWLEMLRAEVLDAQQELHELYGYDSSGDGGSRATLAAAFDRAGVAGARRYLDAWHGHTASAWHLTSACAAILHRTTSAALGRSARAVRLGATVTDGDRHRIESGMHAFRQLHHAVAGLLHERVELQAAIARELDRRAAGQSDHADRYAAMLGAVDARIAAIVDAMPLMTPIGAEAAERAVPSHVQHVGLVTLDVAGQVRAVETMPRSATLRALVKYTAPPGAGRSALLRHHGADGRVTVYTIDLAASPADPSLFVSPAIRVEPGGAIAVRPGDRLELSAEGMTAALVVEP